MSVGGPAVLAESVATSGYAALVLDRLAKQTCQVVESAASSIFARDRSSPGMAIAVAACGPHEDIVGSRFPARERLGGAVVRAGGTTVRRGPLGRRGGRRRGAARATVPARWQGEVRGALFVEGGAEREFGARELELLGELATTAGAALGHVEGRGQVLSLLRARLGKLAGALGAHDAGTAIHSERVVEWSCALGERLRLSMPDLLELELGARFHDLGKVRVPPAVLRKPAALDAGERVLLNRHPVWGAEVLEGVPGLEPVATIVRFHHEWWNGCGYPDGLARDRIPLASRVIAVCDAYHAMTSQRPYRKALPPAAAASELCARAGSQFDPAIVQCFVMMLQDADWGWRV
jgi:HD-GYP domain-containing protein (c-di-GMP phosphodiesterase class II)